MIYKGSQLKRHSITVDGWIAVLSGIAIGITLALNF